MIRNAILFFTVLFVKINCVFAFQEKGNSQQERFIKETKIFTFEKNIDSIQTDKLNKFLKKDQYSLFSIDSFLMVSKLKKKLERDVLFSIVEKNSAAFFEVLELNDGKFDFSKLYKAFSQLRVSVTKKRFKEIQNVVTNCDVNNVYKKEILTLLQKTNNKRHFQVFTSLIIPVFGITYNLQVVLKK